jgi:GxxExxY protein
MSYKNVIYKDESYIIQGAIFEVYREIGVGFTEPVYQECLEKELAIRNIPFQSQKEFTFNYKGELLHQVFRIDLVCYDKILIELKAVKEVNDDHRSQLMNYLKVTGYRLGLLVNYGHHPRVAIERIVM